MKLQVGERLEGGGPEQQPGGYLITAVVRETPWHGLYAGKKIFYNFDFNAKRVRETEQVEWLDVLVRTNRYPILDDPAYVQQRRALARAEVRTILGNRHSNLWAEPLDVFEIENTRDAFTFSADALRGGEPIVVYTKPHGKLTPDWQQQILPVTSILSVLAELLDFIRLAHNEGLLLLGLGPGSLLIDASDRIHYVGSEMVLAQQNALLKDSTNAAVWRRLFPSERFTPGYAAPECFDPSRRPDTRCDLYAWGALAFSLLTGDDLSKIAHGQGRPWITFLDAHWDRLEKVVARLSRNNLEGWAAQLGVDPARLVDAWPRRFLAALRLTLDSEPARRPRNVAELLDWMLDPPPTPVAGFIALHTDADTAKLLLDCTGLEAGLDLKIQCERNAAPRLATDGWSVAEGPVRPVITFNQLPLTAEPIWYTAFTRRREDGVSVYSAGVSALLWQPNPANLREWVEEQAAASLDGQAMPTRVGMVLGALDVGLVVDSLGQSARPRVRTWAIKRIDQTARMSGLTTFLEAQLWRLIIDPSVEMRQAVAATLWTLHPAKTDAILLRLVEALEAPPLDAPIAVAHFLRQLQVPEERVQAVLQQAEATRPTQCPLCKKTLSHGARSTHLQEEHGYVLFDGDLLPAETVMARLWDRVFSQPDQQAHESLVQAYLNAPGTDKSQDAAITRYLEGVQRYFLGSTAGESGETVIPIALPYSYLLAYQANLRQSAWYLPVVRRLLRSPHRRMRDVGVQTALPRITESLGPGATTDDLRNVLRAYCPDPEQTDMQLEICKQLFQAGADQGLVSGVMAIVQEERLVICPECQSEVQTRDLELHLRRAHKIYQFRGKRASYTETRDAMVKAVCKPPADPGAWTSLHSVMADKHGADTDRYVVACLYQHIKDVAAEKRGAIVSAVADTLVAARAADGILPLCVGPSKNASWELLGQSLALEVCSRIGAPAAADTLTALLGLLDQKELPRRSRENAVMALLRSAGTDQRRSADYLRAYVNQSNKKRGIEKLQHLEQRFGHAPAIDLVTQELEDEIRMSCPRCPTELRKKDMVAHLWDQHRLLLDGQRVREPWRVIEDWVVDYGLEKDQQVLARCRNLALRDDPDMGLAKLQRMLYQRGLRDRELLNELRAQAKTRKASLCPHCCASVPMRDARRIKPLRVDESRLEGHEYVIELSERGLMPSLRIESPDEILYRGREPGRWLTRVGGALVFMLPITGVAYGLVAGLSGNEYAWWLTALPALGVGLIGAGLVYLVWPNPGPVKPRLLNAAWSLLVPEMMRNDMEARDWAFLHGLAELSGETRQVKLNQDQLLECAEEASEAARTDPTALACLNALTGRCLIDMCAAKEDPCDMVVTLATECFQGKLALSFLSDLLEVFHGRERAGWKKSDLNRLTMLVADAAFNADLSLDDWLNIGRAFPVAGAVLNLESRWHWLQFLLIWSWRDRKPWEKASPALTMLELAQSPEDHEDVLAYYPDALLFVSEAHLVVGSKGIWIEGVCVTAYTAKTEISVERSGDGYELEIGSLTIRCAENPRPHLDVIKRWLRYWFLDFTPSLQRLDRPISQTRHRMWQSSKLACPDCTRPLVPCPGDLGVVVRQT
jgi:hypothetical protein